MHAMYHETKTVKRIGMTILKQKETVGDIHYSCINQTGVEGKTLKSINAAVGLQPQYIEYAKRGKYVYITT